MRQACGNVFWCVFTLLLALGTAFAQADRQSATLVVNGHTGKAAVIQDNGQTYIDAAGLAQIANGSLSFRGNTIQLILPPAPEESSVATARPHVADPSALSVEFMKAGIEEIALLREWGTTVAYAIQNGYPVQEQWAAHYREQAASQLRLASVAASSEGDKSALQLLSNEFEGVRQWSDRLLEASKNMNTAKYSMSPGTLREEPQSQKLIACWHFLSTMLGSASYQDDSSCR